jgi:hypothetical protein
VRRDAFYLCTAYLALHDVFILIRADLLEARVGNVQGARWCGLAVRELDRGQVLGGDLR